MSLTIAFAAATHGTRLRVEAPVSVTPAMALTFTYVWKQVPASLDSKIDNFTGVSARERRHR